MRRFAHKLVQLVHLCVAQAFALLAQACTSADTLFKHLVKACATNKDFAKACAARRCASMRRSVQKLVHYMHEWLILYKLLQSDANQRMCAQEHVLQKL